MFGGIRSGFIRQEFPGPHFASKKHSTVASLLHRPGAKPARPRRSIVFRSDAPNCEKSHDRPSCPPKSAWQAEHVTYDASCDTLVTLPGIVVGPVGLLNIGAGWP